MLRIFGTNINVSVLTVWVVQLKTHRNTGAFAIPETTQAGSL